MVGGNEEARGWEEQVGGDAVAPPLSLRWCSLGGAASPSLSLGRGVGEGGDHSTNTLFVKATTLRLSHLESFLQGVFGIDNLNYNSFSSCPEVPSHLLLTPVSRSMFNFFFFR